ncbi:hypothetical protein HMPREF3213_02932 [Heyndrickxia coagulans]|uniref:Uncharacterized protein n=1 Tax=Heyndrickxia coagulans TaxID=1398 RepID=A0A133KGL9_HEYCO|nr:hypothetical protein HMPREF3213_02932 [Heyndrickxia coagulans]
MKSYFSLLSPFSFYFAFIIQQNIHTLGVRENAVIGLKTGG